MNWTYEAVPLARDEIHNKAIEMLDKEPWKKGLDVPTGKGILGDRVRKMGFEVSCCEINASYFSVPDLKREIGDPNHHPRRRNRNENTILCEEVCFEGSGWETNIFWRGKSRFPTCKAAQ